MDESDGGSAPDAEKLAKLGKALFREPPFQRLSANVFLPAQLPQGSEHVNNRRFGLAAVPGAIGELPISSAHARDM
jgi:hypothetical protein